jgi:type IV pilus assembly protein PilM
MGDSIWKKEISFGKKSKAPEEPAVDAAPAAPAAEPSQSIWKKDISFGKKAKEPKAAKPEGTSIWKKEISFSKGTAKEDEVARLMESAAQAVDPSYEAAPAPVAPPTELTASVVAAMPPAEPEPVVLLPPPLPEPVAFVPPPPVPLEPAPVTAAPAEPWLAGPELPPAPAPTALPVVVHPPVPAAELPALPQKVPFWKKEIGGKKKAAVPAAAVDVAAAPKTPWWKKEIGGKKKDAAAPVAAAALVEPKTPWWKKEIGGKKKDSVAAVAVAAEPKTPWWKKEIGGKKNAAPAADAPTEAVPSLPFWKRSLSLPALPTLSRGGGRSSGRHAAKKLVGLKIGASQLAAACVSNNGSVQLDRVVREPLLPGVVVGGELRDPVALGDALKAFFERNKLPKKGVRLGLASNRIGVRIVDIAGVTEDKQLANAVQFRAQEALPIPLDEAVLDFRVIDESTDAEGQSIKRVLLVVAHRELIERYLDACKRAGISLMGIDLEAFALLRALSAPVDRGSSALVAVAVGHDRSTFAVSDGRTCEFTRVLEWGGWMLNVALARVFESTPSEVEPLKRQLSLDGTVQPPGLTQEQLALAMDALRKQVQAFARELVASLQFYQNQPGSLGIGEIVLTGGSAHLPGIAEELQRLIGVPVRVGDPLARVVVTKRAGSPEQVGSLAVAIGLGIED